MKNFLTSFYSLLRVVSNENKISKIHAVVEKWTIPEQKIASYKRRKSEVTNLLGLFVLKKMSNEPIPSSVLSSTVSWLNSAKKVDYSYAIELWIWLKMEWLKQESSE